LIQSILYLFLRWLGSGLAIAGRVHGQDARLPEDGEHDLDPVQGADGGPQLGPPPLAGRHRRAAHLHEGSLHGRRKTNQVDATRTLFNGVLFRQNSFLERFNIEMLRQMGFSRPI